MKRRHFMKLPVLAAGAAAAFPAIGGSFGLLTIDGHSAHKRLTGEDLHVWVDGVDVTPSCFEANDVEGYALVWCRDEAAHQCWTAKGAIHVDVHGGRGACQLRVTGHVVIAPGRDA